MVAWMLVALWLTSSGPIVGIEAHVDEAACAIAHEAILASHADADHPPPLFVRCVAVDLPWQQL